MLFIDKVNVTLEVLNLNDNRIGEEGRVALRKVLGGLLIECM